MGYSQVDVKKTIEIYRDSAYHTNNLETKIYFKKKAVYTAYKNQLVLETCYNSIDLANDYITKSDYSSSIKYLKLIKPSVDKLNNDSINGFYSNSMGKYYSQLGDDEKALNYFYEGALYFKKANILSNYISNINTCNNINYYVNYDRINFDSLIIVQQKVLDLSIELKDTNSIIESKIFLAMYYTDINEYEIAKKVLLSVFELNPTNEIDLKNLYAELGRNRLYNEDYKASLNYYNKAIEYNFNIDYVYINDLSFIAENYENLKDYPNAYKTYKEMYLLVDSLSRSDFDAQALEFETKYETTKKEQKNLMLEKENLEKDIRIKKDKNTKLLLILGLASSLSILGLLSFLFYTIRKKNNLLIIQKEKIDNQNNTLKELNKELIKTTDELIASNRYKNKLFSIISHDISSPLRAVTNYISSVELDNVDMNTIRKIQSNLIPIENMTSNLLEWSLIQNKNTTLKLESVNIKNLIQGVLELYNLSLESKNIQIVNNIPDSYSIAVDKNTFTIAIRNILSNCIKFSHRDSTIKVYHEDTKLVIEDFGVGMDENTIHSIYNNSEIASTLGTNREKGTGLGLKLVVDCLKRNQLILIIDSKINCGTKFIIYPQ